MMELFIEGISTAWNLIVSLDAEVLAVTLLSLKISCSATLASLFIGIPVSVLLALSDFPGRRGNEYCITDRARNGKLINLELLRAWGAVNFVTIEQFNKRSAQ